MQKPLPIDPLLPQLPDLLKGGVLVVSAAPGAGKTTRLPPKLLGMIERQVVVLQPRRIAAIAAAHRIAEENNWEVGKEVGYQVRFDNRSSPSTRLLFMTEALLVRKILQDPELSGIGCVVLDEFHERSIHLDLSLGFVKELRELSRPDLKIVVMSATLDTQFISKFLGNAPILEVPGKSFPLEIFYDDRPLLLRTGPDFTDRIKKLILKAAAAKREGDILCFLPGRGEIEWVYSALQAWAEEQNYLLVKLHGQLGIADQKKAIISLSKTRRVILSTNVAETSLTLEGVTTVVDSGVARISQMHSKSGFQSLDLVRISKASATQRAGRAARLGPGTVYRAWIPHDELSMKAFEIPEIQRTDLSESLLLLASMGVTHFESFSWLESPPENIMNQSREFLRSLGAIDMAQNLTDFGRELVRLPVHPRLAALLIHGHRLGLADYAAEAAALLSEGGSKSLGRFEYGAMGSEENDLFYLWQNWKYQKEQNSPILRAANQLKSLLPNTNRKDNGNPDSALLLLLFVYSDRLCRRRRPNDPRAKMVGGRGVSLHQNSSVKGSEYFLALEVGEGRDSAEALVYLAVGIPESLIEKALPLKSSRQLEWDEEKKRFYVNECKEFQGLPIGNEHRRPADPKETEGQLTKIALDRWQDILSKNIPLAHWIARLDHLESMGTFSSLTKEQIKEGLELACFEESSLEKLFQKDLVFYFESILEAAHRRALETHCPSHWTVPTGNRIPIQYSTEQGPSVEVRLQELFGLANQPAIGGKALTLILLAPNFRPVQITRDLANFWKNTYGEVKKDLKSRYPKHSWPEDPLTAKPQSKGRPRN